MENENTPEASHTPAPDSLPKPVPEKPDTDSNGFYQTDVNVNPLKTNEALRERPPVSADNYKRAIPWILLLTERLLEIQGKGERFAFIDFSGHVDWISISVTHSRENFNSKVLERTLYIPGSLNGSVKDHDFNNQVAEAIEKLSAYA